MEATTIEAIAKLWPLALIVFLIIFMILFHKQIRVILEKRSFKVKRGDTEISLEGDISEMLLEHPPIEGKTAKEVDEEDRPETLVAPEDISEEEEKSTDDLWRDMYQAFVEGDISEGNRAFELLQEAEQDVTQRLRNEAFFYYLSFQRGDTSALEKLKEISSNQSIKAVAHYWLGHCYSSTMDYQLAANAYKSAAEASEDPKDRAQYTVSRAEALMSLDDKDDSLNILLKAVNDSDHDVEKVILYQGIATIFEKIGDKKNQAISLENALKFRANDTDLRFKVAYAYSEAGFDQMAMLHYETLLHFKPDSSTSRNNLGVAYQDLGLKSYSSKAYKRASDNAETLASANLAYKYMVEGLYEEAQELLDKAMQQENVHENVGTALASLKDRESEENQKREKFLAESKTLQRHFISYSNAMTSSLDVPFSSSATYMSDEQIAFEVNAKEGALSVHWEESSKKYQITGSMRNLAVEAKKNNMRYSITDKSEVGYKEAGTAYGYFSVDRNSFIILVIENESPYYIELHKTES